MRRPAVAAGVRRPPRRCPRSTASRSCAASPALISSKAPSPTSASTSCPVARSNEKRQGLRRPLAMTSGAGAAGSSRISLPSSELASCALAPSAASPVASHSFPSGPNWSWPPLWLPAWSWRIESSSAAARRVGDVRVGRTPVLAHLQLAGRRGRRRVGARGQIDVEAPGARVVRREGDRQQAALGRVVERDRREVEERARPAAQQLHAPRALGDEHARRVAGRRRGVGRSHEVAGLLQPRRRLRGRGEQQADEDQWSATCPPSGSSGSPCASHSTNPPLIVYAS